MSQTFATVTRLDGDTSHRTFRTLLDAISNPGRIHQMDLVADVPPVLTPVLALADIETTVAVHGNHANDWAQLVGRLTGARLADTADADMCVLDHSTPHNLIAQLPTGTAASPEKGARVFVACTALAAPAAMVGSTDANHEGDSDPNTITVLVTGPGASAGRSLVITGTSERLVDVLQATNSQYPEGVDTWLIADSGDIAAIPRSNRIELVKGAN